MGWQDREYLQRDMVIYPFIFWINDGSQVEPRQEMGGFTMPKDQWQAAGLPDLPGTKAELHFRDGTKQKALFCPTLQVAVLARRFAWVKDGQRLSVYEDGARGKNQYLALVRGVSGQAVGPLMLTFSGLSGKEFADALGKHVQAVRSATQGRAQSYAFYGTFKAGEVKLVGQSAQSRITTVVYADADGFDPDAAYVGDAALDALNWTELEAWEAVWRQTGTEGAEVEDEAAQGPITPARPAPPPPATLGLAVSNVADRILAALHGQGVPFRDSQNKPTEQGAALLRNLIGVAAEVLPKAELVRFWPPEDARWTPTGRNALSKIMAWAAGLPELFLTELVGDTEAHHEALKRELVRQFPQWTEKEPTASEDPDWWAEVDGEIPF